MKKHKISQKIFDRYESEYSAKVDRIYELRKKDDLTKEEENELFGLKYEVKDLAMKLYEIDPQF
jgi:hypothetical protein